MFPLLLAPLHPPPGHQPQCPRGSPYLAHQGLCPILAELEGSERDGQLLRVQVLQAEAWKG